MLISFPFPTLLTRVGYFRIRRDLDIEVLVEGMEGADGVGRSAQANCLGFAPRKVDSAQEHILSANPERGVGWSARTARHDAGNPKRPLRHPR